MSRFFKIIRVRKKLLLFIHHHRYCIITWPHVFSLISGEMCLHVAVANGHVNLVRLLLRLGADLEAKECLAGRTALHLAVERKCWPIITFLMKECEPCLDTKTYSGLTVYQLALYTDRQLARELLRHGAKPEPLPNSDSESSDDELNYVPTILQLNNVQRLKVWGREKSK